MWHLYVASAPSPKLQSNFAPSAGTGLSSNQYSQLDRQGHNGTGWNAMPCICRMLSVPSNLVAAYRAGCPRILACTALDTASKHRDACFFFFFFPPHEGLMARGVASTSHSLHAYGRCAGVAATAINFPPVDNLPCMTRVGNGRACPE